MNTSKHVKKTLKKKSQQQQIKSLKQALSNSSNQNQNQSNDSKKIKSSEESKKAKKASFHAKKKENNKKRAAEEASMTSSAKKRKVKHDRQAKKPNFSLVENMKEFWNAARVKNLSNEDRTTLIASMMKNIRGRVLQVTLRHDASRAVQCILQFGTAEQRRQILEEMSPKIFEIAKTPYGHFVVLKAIAYCTKSSEQTLLYNALRGHFVALGTNVIGARCCESVLQLFPKKLSRDLKAEFYGKKFVSLLDKAPASLQELIEAKPEKKESIMDHMRDLIQKFVDKGLLEFSYSHSMIWEYCQQCVESFHVNMTSTDPNANPHRRLADLVSMLGESVPKILSTKSGARVSCVITTHATAKDRKKIMKSVKGHVLESLLHHSAHLGIMRMVDVTDDTVNVQKLLLDEISKTKASAKFSASGQALESKPPLLSVATHPFGNKLLLRLLSPSKQHLEPDEKQLFHQDGILTSKKSPEARRLEHLAYLRSPLLTICSRFTEELCRCVNGSKVLQEVIAVFFPPKPLGNLVRLLSGQEVAADESDEEVDSDAEVDDDDDNDDNSDDEIDKVADDDEDGSDDEEPSGEDTGDIDDHDKVEQGEDKVSPKEQLPLLPLEEAAVSHKLLRRVLQLQASAEEGSEALTAQWEKAPESAQKGSLSFFPFASELTSALLESGQVERWIDRNRPAFLLLDLLAVPSSKVATLEALKDKKLLTSLKKHAKLLDGPKKLLESVTPSKKGSMK